MLTHLRNLRRSSRTQDYNLEKEKALTLKFYSNSCCLHLSLALHTESGLLSDTNGKGREQNLPMMTQKSECISKILAKDHG